MKNTLLERFQQTSSTLLREGIEKETYAKTKDNSRKKQRKRFHDENGDEPNVLDELPYGRSYSINHFLPIIDSLISALLQRIAAHSSLSKKFGFFAKFGLGEISDDDLCSPAKKLVESYPEDLEPEFETELVHFNAFLKGLRKGGALSNDKITVFDMLLLIDDNSVHELLANVSIVLKLYQCMFVTNCKVEREKLNGAEEVSC